MYKQRTSRAVGIPTEYAYRTHESAAYTSGLGLGDLAGCAALVPGAWRGGEKFIDIIELAFASFACALRPSPRREGRVLLYAYMSAGHGAVERVAVGRTKERVSSTSS